MSPRRIELPSGTWEWSVRDPDDVEGNGAEHGDVSAAAPAGGTTWRRLVLHDPGEPRKRMSVRIPPHLGEPGNERAVVELAKSPDRRCVPDPEGVVWTCWRIPDGEPRKGGGPLRPRREEIGVEREGQKPRRVALPPGRRLGQLTDEELLALIRSP